MAHTPLHEGWSLRAVGGAGIGRAGLSSPVPATIPGCVHTDLLRAGVIDDPFLDDNEVRTTWIGRTDWEYATRFAWTPAGEDRVDLVCAGLDTVAALSLNGVELGQTENMHRGYRFDARAALASGDNTLRVRFRSPYAYAEGHRARMGDRPSPYDEPFNFIRKMACNFGWDWGPTLVTAGIWRPIGLHSWSVARLAQVRPLVTVDGGEGIVEVAVELERTAARPVVLEAATGGAREVVPVAAGRTSVTLRLTVPEPVLWWPRGYGRQALYELTVELRSEDGHQLDRFQRRIGFRSVRLDTTQDECGTPYTLVVNDSPIFVRGVNWIPDDPFPSRITRERMAARLRQAAGANVNFLRVWGGGRYESEDFYELTDELGLLVGQDFLFACAAYPEEAPFAQEIEAEAREQVVRLAPYPSLVLWTGNNENIWGFWDWDWKDRLAGRTWGEGYYHEMLPRVVAELDPTRPYWPGSPYSGRPDRHPNDPAHGTTHIWDVWNTHDYAHYRWYRPRFVAEFGFQAPPTYATLTRAISDAPLTPTSPGMAHHQKAKDGDLKLARGLAAHLPEPRDFDDWLYLTQVNQARAIQLGVEHFRSLRPLCMGTIVWQFNDCWPVTSWSAVDGGGRLKPLWFALRRAFSERLLTIQPRGDARSGDGLAVVAVNDAPSSWVAQIDVVRSTLAGEPRAKLAVEVEVPPGSTRTVPLPDDVATPEDAHRDVLTAAAGDIRGWWFFVEDRDVAYPAAQYDAAVEATAGGCRVMVTARTFLRDLTLFPDRLDDSAGVDDALITLGPGESAVFTVRSRAALDPAVLTVPPVLRCVNDIPRSS